MEKGKKADSAKLAREMLAGEDWQAESRLRDLVRAKADVRAAAEVLQPNLAELDRGDLETAYEVLKSYLPDPQAWDVYVNAFAETACKGSSKPKRKAAAESLSQIPASLLTSLAWEAWAELLGQSEPALRKIAAQYLDGNQVVECIPNFEAFVQPLLAITADEKLRRHATSVFFNAAGHGYALDAARKR